MLTYSFEHIGSVSLYEHLYSCIREDILSGRLRPGERLPSKRPFASNLGVSTITVENAYAQLMAEGYIYTLPKKGCYVADMGDHIPVTAASRQQHAAPETPSKLLDLSDSSVSPQDFPFSVWSGIMRDLLRQGREQLMTRSPGAGVMALRQAIADHLRSFRGMQVLPEQIIVGAGTEYLYGLLIQLLGREFRYAVQDPGYAKIRKIYQSQDVDCVPVAMDHAGLKPDLLQQSGAHIVHISPGHHFPTGIVMPISRRYQLLAWAEEQQGYIIQDDYDSEFRFAGRMIPTLQSIDATGRVIYINTFTKTMASTMRVSYMVLPQDLARQFHDRLSFYACTVPNMDQYALAWFLSQGHFEKHLNRMRNTYRARRDLLLTLLTQDIPTEELSVRGQEAGLHFLIDLDVRGTDEEFCACAMRHGLRVRPLSAYYSDQTHTPAHSFVVSYANLHEHELQQAARQLRSTVKQMNRP